MTAFDPHAFVALVALIGVVILVAAILSGGLDRSGIPPVLVFLLLGLALGPHGVALLDVRLGSPALGVIATLSLVLVLFTDAVATDREGLRRHTRLAAFMLGPGTLAAAALNATAAWLLLDLSIPASALLGAALASTDPVMMRGLLRRPNLPSAARTALGIESGLNDVVVLPIVLVAMTFMKSIAEEGSGADLVRTGLDVFLLGPGAGVLVGFVAVSALEHVRRHYGIRRDYESLYVLGVAFTAYAAAESLQGSGFMAAFAAGLTVAILDVELCDCFHDFGEASAEMFLLFAFVAFGGSLIWSGLAVMSWQSLLFSVVALLGRSAVLLGALARADLDPASRRLIVWFGPRALSSLLLVLLPVFTGIAGSEALFPLCAQVVLLSVVFHGGVLMLMNRQGTPVAAPVTGTGPERPEDAVMKREPELMTLDRLKELWDAGQPVVVLDARTQRSYDSSDRKAQGAVRIAPQRPAESAAELALPREAWLPAYCT